MAVFVVLLPWAAGWWAAHQLAHPPRRPLQDHHLEFLGDPAAHGVAVKSFTCADGTPCLLCEPEPAGMLGKRGLAVREQLAKKNLTLPPPRCVLPDLPAHGDVRARPPATA